MEFYQTRIIQNNGKKIIQITLSEDSNFNVDERVLVSVDIDKNSENVFNESIHGSVYKAIRNLKINEFLWIPIDKYNAARSSGAVLKKLYGCIYHTTRVRGKDDYIKVTRTLWI